MPQSFTKIEKMVLLATLKYIISTDGSMTEREIEEINAIAEDKGFEDFQEIFDEVDKTVKSLEDLKKLIVQVTDISKRRKIMEYIFEIARDDAEVNRSESGILNYMSTKWHIDLDSLG